VDLRYSVCGSWRVFCPLTIWYVLVVINGLMVCGVSRIPGIVVIVVIIIVLSRYVWSVCLIVLVIVSLLCVM
jgi:hypothetical protein